MTALSMAILSGNQQQQEHATIKVRRNQLALDLIQAGAQSYFVNNNESKDLSPVFLACEIEDANLIETMCDHGLNVLVKNSNNQTPLLYSSLI